MTESTPHDAAPRESARDRHRQARAMRWGAYLLDNDGIPPNNTGLWLLPCIVFAVFAYFAYALKRYGYPILALLPAVCAVLTVVGAVWEVWKQLAWKRRVLPTLRTVAREFGGRWNNDISWSSRWLDLHWDGDEGPALDGSRSALIASIGHFPVMIEMVPPRHVIVYVSVIVNPAAVELLAGVRSRWSWLGYRIDIDGPRLRILVDPGPHEGRQEPGPSDLAVLLAEVASALGSSGCGPSTSVPALPTPQGDRI